MRLAELASVFSLAADAEMGMPADHALRRASLAARLAEVHGVTREERDDAFYLALFRYVGCTADSDLAADVFGDEVAVRGALFGADWASPLDVMPKIAGAVRKRHGVRRAARAIAKLPVLFGTGQAHCEVADDLARRLGFSDAFRAALFQTFERYDGKGWPKKLKREGISLTMRIAHVAEVVDIGYRRGGVEAARALVRQRAGGELDASIAGVFERNAREVCAVLAATSAWKAAMESADARTLDADAIDVALAAMGDFADLKGRFTRGHSRGVARLARDAAQRAGLDANAVKLLERAGYVHDLGRVSVSASVWDKPGPLDDSEWERVRMHTYVGERLLSRSEALANVAEIATLAHERLDGRGYHRRLRDAACTAPARILAAADTYHAMIEDRPHRKALGEDRAASLLSGMAKSGSLCGEAVAAVLRAAGQRPPPVERPAGLTEREIGVLRLLARGLTNKEISSALDVSPKTIDNHVQHIYEKIGVTTRAAAAMFAMQKGIAAA